MNLKKILLHNWQAKIVCLVLAAAIWYVLRFYVIPVSGPFQALPPPPEKT